MASACFSTRSYTGRASSKEVVADEVEEEEEEEAAAVDVLCSTECCFERIADKVLGREAVEVETEGANAGASGAAGAAGASGASGAAGTAEELDDSKAMLRAVTGATMIGASALLGAAGSGGTGASGAEGEVGGAALDSEADFVGETGAGTEAVPVSVAAPPTFCMTAAGNTTPCNCTRWPKRHAAPH
jgi:hypothetical protein